VPSGRRAELGSEASGRAGQASPAMPATPTESCPSCGANAGGRAGCQALFDETSALAWSDPERARVHNLVVDAYCMQHPDEYCKSAKSFAAHLTGLCCAMEFGGSSKRYWAIARWLDGNAELEKPVLLQARGVLSIADVHRGLTSENHVERVRAWATGVWETYRSQQDLARSWLKAALTGAPPLGTRALPDRR
jgi:hypothetical protein